MDVDPPTPIKVCPSQVASAGWQNCHVAYSTPIRSWLGQAASARLHFCCVGSPTRTPPHCLHLNLRQQRRQQRWNILELKHEYQRIDGPGIELVLDVKTCRRTNLSGTTRKGSQVQVSNGHRVIRDVPRRPRLENSCCSNAGMAWHTFRNIVLLPSESS